MENENIEYENIPVGNEQPPVEAKRVIVEISKVKYEKNKKLTESGLWISKDKDGKLPFLSALAHLLRFYHCNNISELKNKEIDTTADSNGYIIAKAY